MDKLLYLLPTLMCPIGMGVVMWFLMRTKRGDAPVTPTAAQEQELTRLRKEVDALRAEQDSPRPDLHKGTAT
ncbi:hypothetical protein QMK19_08545 [Streptomyces sp. H10-C2]|uniref:hypothetical protein n=1 Tax=unclassified Streptomyces TaxID=2593676 RepID=UPI0024B901AC|nr:MULTISPECIES: hypothetical protein [unclassified Streptomyces]MDJ0341042.1 hypothetical protein [Streptomyces sp. PH10-H1]MDJ0369726.1 hypothetical protein [Streptomyces sp. H10-C2]